MLIASIVWVLHARSFTPAWCAARVTSATGTYAKKIKCGPDNEASMSPRDIETYSPVSIFIPGWTEHLEFGGHDFWKIPNGVMTHSSFPIFEHGLSCGVQDE